jgi:hypothetical protein
MEKEKAKIELFGLEMIRRIVKKVGKKNTSCRVYLPSEWDGKRIIIIRID